MCKGATLQPIAADGRQPVVGEKVSGRFGDGYDPRDCSGYVIRKKRIRGYSMVNAIENVVSLPVTFSQGCM